MLLKFEFKKIYFKQFAFFIAIAVIVIKAISSVGLYEPDYSSLSVQQQNYYLECMDKFGGKLNDEKEAAIISLHNEAETAKTMQDRIIEKNASGEYETVEAYFAELGKVPEIITKYDAVQLLFRNYSRVSTDKEHLVMLSSDAKGMTCGIEYILIIFICYISAVMCYYERKYKAVYISSTNAVKGSFCRLLALFSVIVLCWICFAVIELFSIITVIGAENLFVGVVSLQAFANTPFKESGILAVFIMIQLTKLCGYLLISALCILLSTLTKNLPLSVFVPLVITCVWVYLFTPESVTFYSPFSLVLGSPYFTGDCYFIDTHGSLLLMYTAPDTWLLWLLIFISLIIVLVSLIIFIKSNKCNIRKNHFALPALLLSVAFFSSGCSSHNISDEAANGAVIASNSTNIYVPYIITDDDYQVVGRKITVYNQNLDLIEDSIIHDITQGKITRQILYSDGYLYFYTNDTITDSNDIYKINLSDYHEECVFAEPDTNEINMYLDIVKIYGSKNPDDYDIRGMSKYGDELYILTNSNKIFAVNVITGIRRLVLEEQYIHCFCMSNNGAIFYINADGNPVCFDNEKKIVSDRVFNNVCADGEYVYCTNKKVTYRYKVSDFSEEKYADVGEIYQVENGKALSSNGIYISEYGKQTKISEEGNLFLLDGKIVRQNGELLSFVEVQLF